MIRTMLSFSIIHLLLVITTFICGLYSIRDYRYTYKRLTGMIYILTGNNDFNQIEFIPKKILIINIISLFFFSSSCFSYCLY